MELDRIIAVRTDKAVYHDGDCAVKVLDVYKRQIYAYLFPEKHFLEEAKTNTRCFHTVCAC